MNRRSVNELESGMDDEFPDEREIGMDNEFLDEPETRASDNGTKSIAPS
jgi:hypothetical protein